MLKHFFLLLWNKYSRQSNNNNKKVIAGMHFLTFTLLMCMCWFIIFILGHIKQLFKTKTDRGYQPFGGRQTKADQSS